MEALRAHDRGADPHAPLWYYVLAEAERQQDGERLGAVGSRIVAETLIGLIEVDETACPDAAPDDWEPGLPQETPTEGYTLADITTFAAEATPDRLPIDAIDPGPGSDAGDGAGGPLNESVTLWNAADDPLDAARVRRVTGPRRRSRGPEGEVTAARSRTPRAWPASDRVTAPRRRARSPR